MTQKPPKCVCVGGIRSQQVKRGCGWLEALKVEIHNSLFLTLHLCHFLPPLQFPHVMNITSITAKLKTEPGERRVSVTGWGSAGEKWSSYISAAEHLTCLSGTFRDARCLLEKVGHRGLADLQVVGSVGLRRQKN